jgi:hypothetical protein
MFFIVGPGTLFRVSLLQPGIFTFSDYHYFTPLRSFFLFFFCGEGPRSRSYGRTAALRLIVKPGNEDD